MEPQAAAIYYKNLVKEFGGRVNEREINLKLAECYIGMYQFDEAEAYLSKFDGIAKDDPLKDRVREIPWPLRGGIRSGAGLLKANAA